MKKWLLLLLCLSYSAHTAEQPATPVTQAEATLSTLIISSPFTGPLGPLFSPEFIKMVLSFVIEKLQELYNWVLVNRIRNAINSSSDSAVITKNLSDVFKQTLGMGLDTTGIILFNTLGKGITQALGSKINRDFAVIKQPNKGKRYVAEEGLFRNYIQAFQEQLRNLSTKEKAVLVDQLRQATKEVQEVTMPIDFEKYLKETFVDTFAEEVFLDTTLAVLLYNKGEQRGYDISLGDLTDYVIKSKKSTQELRDQLQTDINVLYKDKPTVKDLNELNALLEQLSKNINLDPLMQDIIEPYKTFYEAQSVFNKSDNFSDLEKNILTLSETNVALAQEVGQIQTAFDNMIEHNFPENFNLTRGIETKLKDDPTYANYIKLLDARNGKGDNAGDFGIFNLLKDTLIIINNNADAKKKLNTLLDTSSSSAAYTNFFQKALGKENITSLANEYIANIGLSLIALEELKAYNSERTYSYKEVMSLVESWKKQNAYLKDQVLKNMKQAFSVPIETPDAFNNMLKDLHENIKPIPQDLLQPFAIKAVKKHTQEPPKPTYDDITDAIQSTKERGNETQGMPSAKQPVNTTSDNINVKDEENTTEDDYGAVDASDRTERYKTTEARI